MNLPSGKPPGSIFDLYFKFVENTESPLIFHRWSLISCVGAMLARNTWLELGHQRVFPNQYVMLIGASGTRKSSAIKLSQKILAASGFKNFSSNKTSKEKFLLDLEGVEESMDNNVTAMEAMETLFGSSGGTSAPREVFIVADEFNDFMRCGDLEFHSMLGGLWDYDNEQTPYTQRLKNSKSVSIYQPTISILGGNTHEGFSEMFPPQAIGQGFLSRMLLVYSEPSGKKLAFPEPPDKKLEDEILQRLTAIRERSVGAISLSRRSKDILTTLYNSYVGFEDVRFTPYFSRRYTHLLKLCIICSACSMRQTVEEEDVILANTILTYTEHFMPKALGEFGKAKNADVSAKILSILNAAKYPVPMDTIWKQVSSDLERIEDLHKLMQGLAHAGKAQHVQARSNIPAGFMPIRRVLKDTQMFVQFSQLKEYQNGAKL